MNVILACILISSAMLAAEDPLFPDSDRNQVNVILACILISSAMLAAEVR